MIYREFGRTGWKISVIGQGLWNIGNQWGVMEDATAEGIIREAVDQGVNLLDVAESYGAPNGRSEIRLGRILPAIRERVFVVSKIGHWGLRSGQIVPKTTPDMIRLCGHACCGRLRTDRIDLMLCHEGKLEDPSVYIAGFEQLRQEGFIRAYGISTDDLPTLQRFVAAARGICAAVELDYSLVNREAEKELLPYCLAQQLGVIVRGPLARGVLSGRVDEHTVYTDSIRKVWNRGAPERPAFERMLATVRAAQAALPRGLDLPTAAVRAVLAHPAVHVAIPGATSREQVQANARAGAAMLTAGQRRALLGA